MEIFIASLVSVALTAAAGLFYIRRFRLRWLNERKARMENLPPDLELATSEQLFFELRNRQISYILLLPVNSQQEGCFGLTVEVNGISQVNAAGIMGMAATLSLKELKRQGVEFPGSENGEDGDGESEDKNE